MNAGMSSKTQCADDQLDQSAQSGRPITDSPNIRDIILAYYRGEIDEERWAAFNERWFHETYSWYPGLEEELARKMIAEGADAPHTGSGEPSANGVSASGTLDEHLTDATTED